MSDGNRVSLAVVEETTFGQIPSGPPKLQILRKVSETLNANRVYEDSKEIRDDRQTSYSVLVDADGGGEIPFEFSYGSYDMFWEALFQSADWAGIVTLTGAVYSITVAGPVYKIHRSTGDFTAGSIILPYRWVRVKGFTGTGNPSEFYAKVTAVTATDLTITSMTETIVADAEGETVEIEMGDMIVNGTTQRSFAIEKNFADLSATNNFERYLGYTLATGTLKTEVGGILSGSFGFLGKDVEIASATFGDGSPTAATTTPQMNAVTNVEAVLENGAAYGVRSIEWSIDNGLRKRTQVGTLGAIGIGSGTIKVKGTMNVYNSDGAAVTYKKFIDDDPSSVAIVFRDNDGNAYVVDIPNIKFTAGARNTTGVNTDVIIPLAFTATISATEGKTIRMQRWAA